MGFRLPNVLAKQIVRSVSTISRASSISLDVPKGFLAVYVAETKKKRFLVPVSYLNQPAFQELLSISEDEFGFDHPMGALTIPCKDDAFFDVIPTSADHKKRQLK